MHSLSPQGLALITHFEGLRLVSYRCSAGVWTIGWGTTRIAGVAVRAGMRCTREQADAWKRADLTRFAAAVRRLVPARVGLTPHEFDALVSFSYNVGEGALESSTLRKHLLAGVPVVEARFTDWNKARVDGVLRPIAGLTRRRRAEFVLFKYDRLQFEFPPVSHAA